MKTAIIASFVFLLAGLADGSERPVRFVKKFKIPDSSEVAVVAEGEFEPRSVGSYTLRLYGGSSKKFPMDDFVVGVIRPRNGTVEAVRFADLDGDDIPEIVVVIRSVGSGGYISADAFRYRADALEWAASVSGLDRNADPVRALCDKFKIRGDASHSRQSSGSSFSIVQFLPAHCCTSA